MVENKRVHFPYWRIQQGNFLVLTLEPTGRKEKSPLVVLEKTLESPLDCEEIQPVHPKGNQSWIFIERTDGEAETPILQPPDVKNWLIWKDPDAGKNWRREEKGTTEDEMVGCHHQLNGHEFEQILGVGDGQGGLVCCSPWGCKESDTTERLNWNGKSPWDSSGKNAGVDCHFLLWKRHHQMPTLIRQSNTNSHFLFWLQKSHKFHAY